MRISDWSSDVCSSDLTLPQPVRPAESRQAGFGGNSGPGKNHDVANVVHRRHQAAENKRGKAMTRIGLIGAGGRMGRAIAQVIAATPDTEIAGGVDRPDAGPNENAPGPQIMAQAAVLAGH